LRDENGYKRFGSVLQKLGIKHTEFEGDLDEQLDKILSELLDK
jgi:hypothetical protein